ncbi:cell wall-binding repeat-containing protein [Quadrisphaera granulorum]|nr:cell wall-binding repeat-containing protein [Quadrisphaera granulorum]
MTITMKTGDALSRALSAPANPSATWSILETPVGAPTLVIDAQTGLLTGTPSTAGSFIYKVQAANALGRSFTLLTLNVGVTPAKPATAPKATPGQGSATVTWAAPTPSASASPSSSPSASAGLSDAITGYKITPYVNDVAGTSVTASATATSTVVTGLSSGTSYKFKIAAVNAFGDGVDSDASNAVTPFGGVVQPSAGLTRYEGTTRIQTAVSVSQQLFPGAGSSRAVVIASSTNYADSLAGARLASAVGGPLLLTDPLALNIEVATEVARVLAVPSTAAASTTSFQGLAAAESTAPKQTAVGTVYLLGGTSAVSAAVETSLKAVNAKYTINRISGTDRFDTAVKIAAQTAVDDGGSSAPIYVASGANYPDGLAVAALAARTGGVVLLTDGAKMPDATLKYLQTYDPNSELLVAIGGPAATATSGHGAERAVIGTDRYDTARKVAELFTSPTGSSSVRSVGLATGTNWPDALAGAAAMGNLDGPLLLTPPDSLSSSASTAITSLAKKGKASSALVFGGSGVVSSSTASSFSKNATS